MSRMWEVYTRYGYGQALSDRDTVGNGISVLRYRYNRFVTKLMVLVDVTDTDKAVANPLNGSSYHKIGISLHSYNI